MFKNANLIQEYIHLEGTIEIEKWTKPIPWYHTVWEFITALKSALF